MRYTFSKLKTGKKRCVQSFAKLKKAKKHGFNAFTAEKRQKTRAASSAR